jgi:uncharacterized lipoprotein YddW (UPF0748 family)
MDFRAKTLLRMTHVAALTLVPAVVCTLICFAPSGCAGTGAAWTSTGASELPQPPEPAREFRGVWVATVANIDWPSSKTLDAAAQQREMTEVLDRCVELKLNAVLLQVRPSCDAIYPSALEPWSEFVSGASGRSPGYDPLAEWIARAHERGIELHAWINPFRARHVKAETPLDPRHIAVRRPDLVRSYDGMLWLDPGEPEAREYSLNVVSDLVSRYNIDGVHIDDYFYPYPKTGVPFPDDKPFAAYQASGGTQARDDWRRDNINTFVRELYKRVKDIDPRRMVGISPFGIWRPGSPAGVKGFDAYAGLYADAALWLREGWLDYAAPQLYWAVSAPAQPFEPLLRWWMSQNPTGRHVWPGLYTSRIKASEGWAPAEIESQIAVSRSVGSGGHIHFSMVTLQRSPQDIAKKLQTEVYTQDALVPESPWLAPRPPVRPRLSATGGPDGTLRVRWRTGDQKPVRRWVLSAQHGEKWTTTIVSGTARSAAIATQGPSGPLRAISLRAIAADRSASDAAVLMRTETSATR